MNNSICSEDVRADQVGFPGGGLYHHWTISINLDLLTPCCLPGFAIPDGPDVYLLKSGTRNNMAEKNSCHGVRVIEEVVEGVLIDLGKSIIGGGEEGEGTLAREGFGQVGSLDGIKEGREPRSGSEQLYDVLIIVIVIVVVVVVVIVILEDTSLQSRLCFA